MRVATADSVVLEMQQKIWFSLFSATFKCLSSAITNPQRRDVGDVGEKLHEKQVERSIKKRTNLNTTSLSVLFMPFMTSLLF